MSCISPSGGDGRGDYVNLFFIVIGYLSCELGWPHCGM